MDKNGARGLACKVVSIVLDSSIKDGVVDAALNKQMSPEDTALVRQAIQDIANKHAEQAKFHRAIESGESVPGEVWDDATITLGDERATTYPGKKFGESGLGYWIAEADEDESAFYTPTHIPSGYGVGGVFYSEEQCKKYIRALASCMKWDQPREALIADPEYQPELFKKICETFRFEDAAETAGGGRW